MGLGKTIVALWWILAKRSERLPAIVICPAVAKYVWENEAAKHFDQEVVILEGRKATCPHSLQDADIIVINYDILDAWTDVLKALKPRAVVVDESQYIANRNANRTRRTFEVCRGVPYVLALSGTPMMNRPVDLWNTLNLLRPDVFRYFRNYATRYCGPRWAPYIGASGGWEYKGATHLNELNKIMRDTLLIRYRKQDVLTDLPPKIRQIIPCALSDRAEYKRAENWFLTWLREKHPKKMRGAEKAEALVRTGELLRLSARLKLRAVTEWINDRLEIEDKLVAFAKHTKMIEALKRRCNGKSVVINGSVSHAARRKRVKQFQNDPKTKIFLGNLRAAGVSIPLTAASIMAITELDWVPSVLLQAEDREHRIGQKGHVWIYYLVAQNTIEEKLCRTLVQKQENSNQVLDGGNGEMLNVFDSFLEEARRNGR
jgi:SWI/SNF-related matrix-associated actin-dependent regulator 1 of chromatin subfamily A